MSSLRVIAGASAYRHIQSRGLSSADVSAVFGASGAAKWLAIVGLDKAVFAEFLADCHHPIQLYGTSVGAFKLAAACQQDPLDALTRLAQAYIDQQYPGKITADSVVRETRKIIDTVLTEQGVREILEHPNFSFHCGAVRCKGLLASSNRQLQKLAMVQAFLLSLVGCSPQAGLFSRSIFGDPRRLHELKAMEGMQTDFIATSKDNLQQAVLASGSIPVLMPGVTSIPGSPATAVYRDGGLLDYHPVPEKILLPAPGLVLYPHFYPYLIEGWFDKFFPWRKVPLSRLDNVLMVAPSEQFIRSLPNARIPDRQDFYRYQGRDTERQAIWTEVMGRSEELGEEWLSLIKSGRIADVVEVVS